MVLVCSALIAFQDVVESVLLESTHRDKYTVTAIILL